MPWLFTESFDPLFHSMKEEPKALYVAAWRIFKKKPAFIENVQR